MNWIVLVSIIEPNGIPDIDAQSKELSEQQVFWKFVTVKSWISTTVLSSSWPMFDLSYWLILTDKISWLCSWLTFKLQWHFQSHFMPAITWELSGQCPSSIQLRLDVAVEKELLVWLSESMIGIFRLRIFPCSGKSTKKIVCQCVCWPLHKNTSKQQSNEL